MNARYNRKLSVFVEFCESLSKLSTCKRSKVGCVVVTPELSEVLAIGYNGPPSGLSNDSCRSSEGGCGCIHAESNALVKLSSTRDDLVLVCSRSPCEHCAGLVINSKKIARVLYVAEYRCESGLTYLSEAGVDYSKFEVTA